MVTNNFDLVWNSTKWEIYVLIALKYVRFMMNYTFHATGLISQLCSNLLLKLLITVECGNISGRFVCGNVQ
jgi:hypothetical protein